MGRCRSVGTNATLVMERIGDGLRDGPVGWDKEKRMDEAACFGKIGGRRKCSADSCL